MGFTYAYPARQRRRAEDASRGGAELTTGTVAATVTSNGAGVREWKQGGSESYRRLLPLHRHSWSGGDAEPVTTSLLSHAKGKRVVGLAKSLPQLNLKKGVAKYAFGCAGCCCPGTPNLHGLTEPEGMF